MHLLTLSTSVTPLQLLGLSTSSSISFIIYGSRLPFSPSISPSGNRLKWNSNKTSSCPLNLKSLVLPLSNTCCCDLQNFWSFLSFPEDIRIWLHFAVEPKTCLHGVHADNLFKMIVSCLFDSFFFNDLSCAGDLPQWPHLGLSQYPDVWFPSSFIRQ